MVVGEEKWDKMKLSHTNISLGFLRVRTNKAMGNHCHKRNSSSIFCEINALYTCSFLEDLHKAFWRWWFSGQVLGGEGIQIYFLIWSVQGSNSLYWMQKAKSIYLTSYLKAKMDFFMGISAPLRFSSLLLIPNGEENKCKDCYRKRNYCYLFSYTFFITAFTTFGTLKHNPFHAHLPGENQYESIIWAISTVYTEQKNFDTLNCSTK